MARPKVPIQAVSLAAFLFAGLLPGYPCTVSAQVRDTAKVDSAVARARQRVLAQSHTIKLHEVAFVGGVMGLAFLVDQPLQRYIQDHRNGTTNDISSVFRREGEPVYYAGMSLGILATGIIFKITYEGL